MYNVEKKNEEGRQQGANPMYPQQQEQNLGNPTSEQVQDAVRKLHPDEHSKDRG